MYKVIVYANSISQYLLYFRYKDKTSSYAENEYDYAYGFFKPKEEFEEYFKYITGYGSKEKECDHAYDLYLTQNQKYEYHPIVMPSVSGFFTFEFPDEETALYFKLKFNN